MEQNKTSNSNDEAGKQNKRLETKNLTFEIQTQLSNEGLQNGVGDSTTWICQNA